MCRSKVLQNVCRPNKTEIIGGWRKSCYFYSTPYSTLYCYCESVKDSNTCGTFFIAEMRETDLRKIIVRGPPGKGPGCRLEDNIIKDHREVGLRVWTGLK